MRYNKDEIKVKAGQTVRLTLKHVGEMEKSVMGHNWVLLKQGTVINEFGQKAVQAKDNDYIPEGTDAVITHTKMIGGGEEVTIEFEAPAAGEYDFICSFPGHYSVMNGKFIVEEQSFYNIILKMPLLRKTRLVKAFFMPGYYVILKPPVMYQKYFLF